MRRTWIAFFAITFIASTVYAVDFGWQPLNDGGLEYIVQVEPELIDSFRQNGFSSEVPLGLRDIRRIRIQVGTEKLPNQGDLAGPKIAQLPPPPTMPPASTEAPSASAPSPAASAPAGTQSVMTPPSTPPTFGTTEPKAPTPQSSETASNSSASPPLIDSSHPAPSLPFFQASPAKGFPPNTGTPSPTESVAHQSKPEPNGPSADSKPPATVSEAPGKPALSAKDTPPPLPETDRQQRRAVEAGMPAASTNLENKTAPIAATNAAPSKPWPMLVFALLALFASLGANIYLVGIYQSVRLKYQSLVAQMRGEAATA